MINNTISFPDALYSVQGDIGSDEDDLTSDKFRLIVLSTQQSVLRAELQSSPDTFPSSRNLKTRMIVFTHHFH